MSFTMQILPDASGCAGYPLEGSRTKEALAETKEALADRRAICQGFRCGLDRRRSGDLSLFRRALCQLSYETKPEVSLRM
jgi:hypothetical protein